MCVSGGKLKIENTPVPNIVVLAVKNIYYLLLVN